MKKFIIMYHTSAEAISKMKTSSSSEMKNEEKLWITWAEKCGDKLVDMGAPLMGGIKLSPDGSSSKSTEGVVGYSVLQAENMDDARSLMEAHPHLQWSAGCDIVIHESGHMPG